MENVQAKPSLLHRIISLAILGFLLVILSGPLVTILSFALIGFAGWVIYRAFTLGKRVAWNDVRQAAKVVWEATAGFATWVCGKAGEGFQSVRQDLWPTVKSGAVAVGTKVRNSAGLVYQILIEAV